MMMVAARIFVRQAAQGGFEEALINPISFESDDCCVCGINIFLSPTFTFTFGTPPYSCTAVQLYEPVPPSLCTPDHINNCGSNGNEHNTIYHT